MARRARAERDDQERQDPIFRTGRAASSASPTSAGWRSAAAPKQVLGRPLHEQLLPEQRDRAARPCSSPDTFDKRSAVRRAQATIAGIRARARTRHLDRHKSPLLRDGRSLASAADVTERVIAQQKLQTHEGLGADAEISPLPLSMLDTQGAT